MTKRERSKSGSEDITPGAVAQRRQRKSYPQTPVATKNKRKRPRHSEGENLTPESNAKKSKYTSSDENASFGSEQSKPTPERCKKLTAREEERRELEAMVNAPAIGWTGEEDKLYRMITMRGHDPILPCHWRMDFPTIPPALFCFPHEPPFFSALSGNDFHATRSLYNTLSLGQRVRDYVQLGKRPELLIKREIEAYIAWSEKDGGFAKKPHPPLIVISTPSRSETVNLDDDAPDINYMEQQAKRRLRAMVAEWEIHVGVVPSVESEPETKVKLQKGYPNAPPTLYALLIWHTVVGIATYDAAKYEPPLRTVGIVDLGKVGQDVWNGLAIAGTIIVARDWAVSCEQLMSQEEPDSTKEDPDA